MAGLWRLQCIRRKAWHCDIAHQALVYLYFFPHIRFAAHCLYDTCLLDEYAKLHLAT